MVGGQSAETGADESLLKHVTIALSIHHSRYPKVLGLYLQQKNSGLKDNMYHVCHELRGLATHPFEELHSDRREQLLVQIAPRLCRDHVWDGVSMRFRRCVCV